MLMREFKMNKQADLLLVEEFSEQELEAISGGKMETRQQGLINVSDVTVNVALVALNSAPVMVSQQD
jgi:hypothetical protein